jgi:hypothetical protein
MPIGDKPVSIQYSVTIYLPPPRLPGYTAFSTLSPVKLSPVCIRTKFSFAHFTAIQTISLQLNTIPNRLSFNFEMIYA